MGRARTGSDGIWAPFARRAEPLESEQGSLVGTAPTRTGRGSRLRSHAGQPVSTYRAISEMAFRQEARRLHVRAARGYTAAGVVRNFRYFSLMPRCSSH